MTRRKPTRYAQKACCVGYWTQAVNGWTLSAKYWTVCTSQQKVDITLYFYTSFNEHNTPYTVLESDNSESMPDVLH